MTDASVRTERADEERADREGAVRPNILLVMCDQLSALATSPYGNEDVLTPHLDELAANGVLFRNAYCNAPLCAPSRASMMTGRLSGRIPVNDNSEELPASIPTFAHHLRRGGYKTVLAGKMHFVGPDQLHGFEERLTTDVYPADFWWTQSWEALGDPPHHPMGDAGYVMCRMVTEAGPVEWSAQLEYDDEVHHRAMERLRRFARRKGDASRQPWFLCVSYTQPHDPYAPSQPYWERYEGREIALPGDPPADRELGAWDRWVNAYHGVDTTQLSRDDVYRARRGYYAMTSYIDDKLGELMRELRRLGVERETVVLFTSDHGDMLGEHGMFFKRTFREWSARVPLIAAGPGIARGHEVAANVSLLDLYPTIVDLAGLEMPHEALAAALDGATLTPFLGGREPAGWRDRVVIEQHGEGTIRPARVLVEGRYKYVFTHREPELLFDLAQDPGETVDLAARPEHRSRVAAMREACLEGWDADEAERGIIESQRLRLFLNEALSAGAYTAWDFQPVFDATGMHVRRELVQRRTYSSPLQWDPRAGGG